MIWATQSLAHTLFVLNDIIRRIPHSIATFQQYLMLIIVHGHTSITYSTPLILFYLSVEHAFRATHMIRAVLHSDMLVICPKFSPHIRKLTKLETKEHVCFCRRSTSMQLPKYGWTVCPEELTCLHKITTNRTTTFITKPMNDIIVRGTVKLKGSISNPKQLDVPSQPWGHVRGTIHPFRPAIRRKKKHKYFVNCG